MQISEAIIHNIKKECHGEPSLQVRESLLPLDTKLKGFVENIRNAYNSIPNINYGVFDGNNNGFPSLARELCDGNMDFVTFSQNSAEQIKREMFGVGFATGGYMFCARYKEGSQEYLMVVMLKLKPSVEINEATLELMEGVRLNIEKLHEAARLNVTRWYDNENNECYLSFITKKSQKEDVSLYFRRALACTAGYSSGVEYTKALLKAVDDFVSAKELPDRDKQDYKDRIRKKTFDYCEEVSKNGAGVDIQILSQRLDEENPEAFVHFIRSEDRAIADGFKPSRQIYRRFQYFNSKSSWLKIGFDHAELGARIRVDYENGEPKSLTVSELPNDLKEQLREARA